VDSLGNVGQYSSIAIGFDGAGLISYWDLTNGGLKVAHCANVACTAAGASTLDGSGVGAYTSVTVGADGMGLVGYRDISAQSLNVAHCSNVACTAATATTLDAPASTSVAAFVSITISEGLGLVVHRDATNSRLKVVRCANVVCDAASVATVDSPALTSVGQYTSVTTGPDGFGLISYYDVTNGDLKLAHCSNTACTPNVRQR